MPSHSSSHPHARHASPSTSSSVKPTGWIRSSSAASGPASKPRSGVLSDRTNLPSSSHTPLKSLPKPPNRTLVASRLAGHTRTPAPSNSTKQQTLSRFFAPNTAPAGPSKSTRDADTSSPSVNRPRLSSTDTRGAVRRPPTEPRSAYTDAFNDDDLEARAACLLRGRFGSVSRSLSTSMSSTPTATVSPPTPPSDEPPRSPPAQARSRVDRVRPPNPMLPPAEPHTPPRKRHQPNPPSSPFQPTLMAESLSNFTPPAWAKSIDRKLALFQRMAGIQDDVVREQEKRQMETELDRAHRRLQGSSPAAAKSKRPPASRQRTSLAERAEAAPTKRMSARTEQMPETLLRSPTTNRRIYALETQLVPAQRATLQPASRVDKNASESGRSRPLCARADPVAAVSAEATQDESETLPLAWPVEGDDETQPLAWDDGDDEAAPIPTEAVHLPHAIGSASEVPTSDDDDFLTEPGLALEAAHDSTPVLKRRRMGSSPRTVKASPVSLTSASGAGRFDSVVAALRRQERRQNSGMQLSLDRYVSKPTCKLDSDDDLDVLSDDEAEDETRPLEWTTPVKRPTLQLASSPAAATQLSTSSGASASASEISLPSQTALNDADTQTRTFFERL